MSYVFESLYSKLEKESDNTTPNENSVMGNQEWAGSIKMMDTILF